MEKHPESLHFRFSKRFVLESIKLILENKNYTFHDEFCRQISGTAMGTTFAPAHLTLTMGYCEVSFYNICELKRGREFEEFPFPK